MKLIAVVGQARTGTTVLRQMLGSTPDYFDLGEIFHGDVSFEVNFWAYLLKKSNTDTLSITPNYWYDMWPGYISSLREKFNCGNFIIDVKIETFGNVLRSSPSGAWFFFPTENMRFIYIERKNIAAQLVSRLKAERTNDWGWRNGAVSEMQLDRHYARFERRGDSRSAREHVDATDDGRSAADLIAEARAALRNSPFHVDPDAFAVELAKINAFNSWGLRQLAPYDPHILYYENMFDTSGHFNAKTLQRLGELADVDVKDFAKQPMLLKQAPDDFLEGISNRTELIRKFRATQFAWMFPFY